MEKSCFDTSLMHEAGNEIGVWSKLNIFAFVRREESEILGPRYRFPLAYKHSMY